jgi:hypothetical protein
MLMLVLHKDALLHWPADLFLTLLANVFQANVFRSKDGVSEGATTLSITTLSIKGL